MDIRKLLSAKKPKIVDEEDVTGEDNFQQCNTSTSLGLANYLRAMFVILNFL